MKEDLFGFKKMKAGLTGSMQNMKKSMQSASAQQYMSALIVVGMISVLFMPDAAYAASSSSSMPWDDLVCRVATSATGTWAKGGSMIATVLCGLTFAFGEAGTMFKKLTTVIFGCSFALCAASWIGNFADVGTVACSS